MSDITQLTEELRELVELELVEKQSQHYPFKTKAKLGPGPRGGTNRRANKWQCTCGNYVCTCKGVGGETKGQTKQVVIGQGYKRDYNKEYKSWSKAKSKAKKKKPKKAAKK